MPLRFQVQPGWDGGNGAPLPDKMVERLSLIWHETNWGGYEVCRAINPMRLLLFDLQVIAETLEVLAKG